MGLGGQLDAAAGGAAEVRADAEPDHLHKFHGGGRLGHAAAPPASTILSPN